MRGAGRIVVGVVSVVLVVGAAPIGSSPAGAAGDSDPWSQRRVLNVAHAAGDLEAPHSTLFAMHAAVAAGADVLEMDVRLSADGVLMVQHDDTVDRTTESSGPVATRTAAQLQALDNGYWFVPECWSCHDRPAAEYAYRGIRTGDRPPPAGFTADDFAIPTLEQVAARFPDRLLDVEIKDGPTGMAAAEALAAFIAGHGPSDRYLVASFDDAILAHFKTLAPAVATSPGLNEMITWFALRGPLPTHRVLQVPPVYSGIEVVSRQFVDDAHANGLAVWVWFNGNDDDAPAEWQRLMDLGVDALLTGKPRLAQAELTARDAAFTAAPEVGPAARAGRRRAEVSATCPAVHVATCTSLMVVVARDRHGRWQLVGESEVRVARSASVTVDIRLSDFARRSIRGRHTLDAFALMFPLDDDTAPVIAPVAIARA